MKVFSNEALTDFSDPKHRQAMVDALASVGSEFGLSYPLVIGGQAIATARTLPSVNPSRHEQVVGLVAQAGREQAEQAMEAAWRAFADWRHVPVEGRAACLFKLAGVMRRRKAELSAWLVFEVAKNWREADADVAEAIDFCEYYGREMLRYDRSDPVFPLEDEDNHQRYVPLGVGIIISPWNFPLAILTGMSMAAVVAGNTVIIKPANTAGVIAAKLMEMVAEAGFPAGVVNYLPGSGADIGEYLIQHPRTRFISFTGSKDVGLHINEMAARTQPGQKWIKRVVAEMGGKDCIIVDETADLDAAAQGIVRSAFGFQGQKCSACSRAIVVDSVYDTVLERVIAGATKLSQGQAVDNADVCAVIDDKAFASIMRYIGIGAAEGRIVAGGHGSDEHGYFIEPTVVADVAPRARVAQEEIFGPVLSYIHARDFADAIAIGNGTEYGLTGAAYSRDRSRLEQAKDELEVGNLYLNRGCTGAFVGVHPFGGFNMSGTDSKAGGPDYLQLFLQAKSISEALR